MIRLLFPMLTVLVFTTQAADAEVVDDFSGDDWKLSSSTPGQMTTKLGKMHLVAGREEPNWVTASKTFPVDFDQTPYFLVEVEDVSDSGTVKLIRKQPFDKRVALRIDQPGLYTVDMRGEFGWRGPGEVETCLYANGKDEEITFEYVKFAAKLSQKERALLEARTNVGNSRLAVETFEVVPLFNACSYYLPSRPLEGVVVAYRQRDGMWRKALPPPYFPEDGMYRGSIVGLDEDTEYEVRVADESGEVLAQQEFRTWRTDVPVAKTIVLDAANFSGHLTIRDEGAPDGWIKYTTAPGFTLRNDRDGPLLELYRAKYVLLEGLTLRGGLKQSIAIEKCEHVRVVNCDIAGWGRIGQQRFDRDGKYYTEGGGAINWDTAILVSKSLGTVVERCYIHDPVNKANPWYYSHPSGPQAVGIDKPRSTVLRYNDFIGSDPHRWNDAVEGSGNFYADGGFNRDADIYGNLMCFANDDAIEIDGGQTNVRVYLNKFEGCLCGVSIQGCMSSPSYVYRNLMVNLGDENGVAGQTIKTSSFANGASAVSFLFNNTCYGGSGDLSLRHNLQVVAKNNIFASRTAIGGRSESPQSECDYNLLSTGDADDEEHGLLASPRLVSPADGLFSLSDTSPARERGVAIPNFAGAPGRPVDLGAIPHGSGLVLPLRPIPVTLDRYQLMFSPAESAEGGSRSVTATVAGEKFASEYVIARNEAFDWFRVSPVGGTLRSGQRQTFTVALVPERMRQHSIYRGAFLIRLANGYSRPVMVYARAEVAPVVKPSREGVFVQYLEAESPPGIAADARLEDSRASGGECLLLSRKMTNPIEYRFSVPRDATYFVLMRVRSDEPVRDHDTVRFAIDGGRLDEACLLSVTSWTWSLAGHNRQQRLTRLQPIELSAGEHVLELAPRDAVHVDLIAVTDNPGMFDERGLPED